MCAPNAAAPGTTTRTGAAVLPASPAPRPMLSATGCRTRYHPTAGESGLKRVRYRQFLHNSPAAATPLPQATAACVCVPYSCVQNTPRRRYPTSRKNARGRE